MMWVATRKLALGFGLILLALFMIPIFWFFMGIDNVVSERIAIITGFLAMLSGISVLVRPMDSDTEMGLCLKS